MAAAFSIISLVIFFAAWAFACAHSTPGKSVPARPIPEHVFMKSRRSSIFILPIGQSRRRARKISQHPLCPVAAFLRSQNGEEPWRRGSLSLLFSGRKQMLYDARTLKGASMARFAKLFVLLSVLLLGFSTRHLRTAMAGGP